MGLRIRSKPPKGAALPHLCCQGVPQEDWTSTGSGTQSRATFRNGFGQSHGAASGDAPQAHLQFAANQPSDGFLIAIFDFGTFLHGALMFSELPFGAKAM